VVWGWGRGGVGAGGGGAPPPPVKTVVSNVDNGRRGFNCRLVIARVNGISLKS
jgi:hypothetical protein